GMEVVHLARQIFFRERRGHRAAPAFEQGAHAGADRRIVIQHPDARALQALEYQFGGGRLGTQQGRAPGQWHLDGEPGPSPRLRADLNAMTEYARDLLDDGQAEAQATVLV